MVKSYFGYLLDVSILRVFRMNLHKHYLEHTSVHQNGIPFYNRPGPKYPPCSNNVIYSLRIGGRQIPQF